MAEKLNLSLDEIAYIGDDMPDHECIDYVGLGIAVQDAHPSILSIANYTTFNRGGFGAVREICDLIMLSQNTLANASGASI
jgi:3-deoxy-D-manno-octulosonate 8-phosphate phosphatase (KDO 8-P phosphatase)